MSRQRVTRLCSNSHEQCTKILILMFFFQLFWRLNLCLLLMFLYFFGVFLVCKVYREWVYQNL